MSLFICPLVKCPHCGLEQPVKMEITSTILNRFFVTCDLEEGGCDETFALEVNLKTHLTIWKLEPASGVQL